MNRKEIAQDFLRLAAKGDARTAFACYVGAGFRHHNPWFKGDGESLMLAMEEAGRSNPDKIFDVQRTLEEDDWVAVHSCVRQHAEDAGGAVVHIFRFEGDRIVELWDVGQQTPAAMANEHGMF